ncbi:hypothetical protein [Actinomyces qiguomingii]|uniref:hypothetical protein n=1 Tax=Actinomyces qiguomingii TaxID=2057800 RepID=UPI000CA02EF6|nr:hypothetical protein [Actinomyces qiguomingii]
MARNGGLAEANRDSVTTSLAVGLGHLYQLALGLRALSLSGKWTDRDGVASGAYPDLMSMHDAVFDFLSMSSPDPGQEAGRWLSRINTDPVVPRLVTALGAYWDGAAAGPAEARGSGLAWSEVANAVEPDPLEYELNILGGPNGEPAEYLAWRRSVHTSRGAFKDGCGERLAATVETIWFTLGACSRDGAFGHPGEVFAAEILPAASPRRAPAAA